METLLTDDPAEAAALLRAGEAVAFPTETVYGLGADAFDPDAVRKIFAAKRRPADNPLIVHLSGLDQLPTVARSVSASARTLIDRFFPGPLTVLLPRQPSLPSVVTAGLDTVGVRMPRHSVARAFLAACGRPVAAPSANVSGRPSPTTWQAVQADFDGRIACILKGDRTPAGLESTVVDCTGAKPVLLRAGVVTLEALRSVLPDVLVPEEEVLGTAPSPGMRHRHYAPNARVRVIDHPSQAIPAPDTAYIGLDAPERHTAFGLVLQCNDMAHYAHELFHFFRCCDTAGLATIYAQAVAPEGLGRALMDRLHRAARG